MLEKLNLTLRRWLTWTYPSNVGQSPRNWTRASRAILFATKGDDYTFNPYADPQPFRNPDDQRIQALIAEGREGVTPYDWWEFNLVKNVSAEKTGWENQLPLALVERIVKTSSNEGDIVLDPFMGSGTTAEAATRNKRRWLGFDRNPDSSVVTAARLEVETE
jgi:DNA modification methylase